MTNAIEKKSKYEVHNIGLSDIFVLLPLLSPFLFCMENEKMFLGLEHSRSNGEKWKSVPYSRQKAEHSMDIILKWQPVADLGSRSDDASKLFPAIFFWE